HTVIYCRCRKAMIALSASSMLLQRYQELKQEHLQSKTMEIDPSVTGTWGKILPYLPVCSTCSLTKKLTVLQVKFHRAKANVDHCTEEVVLLKMEMQWAANFFRHHSDKWKRFAAEAEAKRTWGGYVFPRSRQRLGKLCMNKSLL
ncbi:hypothetical protein HYDPIDRAFT_80567, partial [Hydnomerulius pinastri MD-312]